jgi:hypothetical protein
MLIEPLHTAPGAPAVLRRRHPFAANTHRINPSQCQGQERFKTNIASPVSAKVIHIPKSLTVMEPQVTEPYVVGVCTAAAILLPVDVEAVQMLIAPGQHDLEDGVKLRQGRLAAHKQAVPNEPTDAA